MDFRARSGNARLNRVWRPSIIPDLLRGTSEDSDGLSILLFTGIGTAVAQPAGPYLTGQVGTSAGDGGAALMTGVAVGYMSPKRLAFELEITVSPSLDFDPPRYHPRDLPAAEIRVGQDDRFPTQCGWHLVEPAGSGWPSSVAAASPTSTAKSLTASSLSRPRRFFRRQCCLPADRFR